MDIPMCGQNALHLPKQNLDNIFIVHLRKGVFIDFQLILFYTG